MVGIDTDVPDTDRRPLDQRTTYGSPGRAHICRIPLVIAGDRRRRLPAVRPMSGKVIVLAHTGLEEREGSRVSRVGLVELIEQTHALLFEGRK
ncbi:hypothetical protein Vau01_093900 [Virgisporangium aurantiacum]|uniref:Uncharacterized protein n=1 Tax=Virgisporangium aurantiacum TaxID=175570 RepID=A0A8J3ZDA3_9ACTN|nr:hypothetical protein Vau01_093900 [Virgisporangium aurantiacum]